MSVLVIIFISIALIAGVVAGFMISNSKLNKSGEMEKENFKKQKENMLKEAEVKNEALKQEKILQAKEKFLQLKAEHDKTTNERNQQLVVLENKAKVLIFARRFVEIDEFGIHIMLKWMVYCHGLLDKFKIKKLFEV